MEVNKIYNENCLETMSKMEDKSIDLTVTSPPYDGLRKYNGFVFDFEKTASELYRVTKDGGVVVWVVSDQTIKGSETATSFKQALYFISIGFLLHDTMIYESVGLTLNHNRYEQNFEYMFVFSKGKPKTFNAIKIPCIWHGKDSDRSGQTVGIHEEISKKLRSGNKRGTIKPEKIKGNIWRYNTGFGHSTKDKGAFKHPAIFPEKLAADHIWSWSQEGDIVFDPFLGSGTTAKCALQLNRKFIGSELSAEYCEIANKRIEPILKQTVLF